MEKLKQILLSGNNVYRTRDFIVEQKMSVVLNSQDANGIVSQDTYLERTPKRDKLYEQFFRARDNIEGKRLPSTMYSREYVG